MKRIILYVLCLCLCLGAIAPGFARADAKAVHGFIPVASRWIDQESANATLYRHEATGLSVFHLENDSDALTFSIGFITPPKSDRGANHVLEHTVLCGNEKYPARSLMHHLRSTSVASVINATTNDQTTAYHFRTDHPADFYNLLDVYMHAVLAPMVLREENIFLQQGMRWEITEDGATPNGVVYNELRQSSLETGESQLGEVRRMLNASLFEADTPVFSSGGEVEDLLELSYDEVLDVYNASYHPANALVFLSGRQNLEKTLALLDDCLQNVPGGETLVPVYRLRKEPMALAIPENMPEDALVDIGFAFSGIPANEPRQVYARDAMLMLLIEHLRTEWPDVVMASDDTSGYATFAVIVPGVPGDQAEAFVDDVERFLKVEVESLLQTEAYAEALDTYEWMIEDGNGWALFSTLKGFANGGDPFALVEKEADFAYLREHPEFVQAVWAEHLTGIPHKAVAVLAQQSRPDAAIRSFSKDELATLQEKDAAFRAWVDAPETPEETANLPRLRIEDFMTHTLDYSVETIDQDGMRIWFQPDDAVASLSLSLAAPYDASRWMELSLLAHMISSEVDAIREAYFVAYNDLEIPGNVLPQFVIAPSEGEGGIGLAAKALLQPDWLTAEALEAFLTREKERVDQYLRSPFSRTIELMFSDISPKDRFAGQTLGLINSGTEDYLRYVQGIPGDSLEALAGQLRALAISLANRQDMLVSIQGEKASITPVLEDISKAFPLTEAEQALSFPTASRGTHSALVIAPQAEATVHYMQVGLMEGTDWSRSGQMDVMAQVVQNGYLLPELRNKRGAYGAQLVVEDGYVTLGASGVQSIDETYDVMMGAGQFLRDLSMDQEALDAIIVATVHAFDQMHGEENYFAMEAELTGWDIDRLIAHREEMLATTVEDVRGFADFLEAMVLQQRIFAYTNEMGAGTSLSFERISTME